MRFVILKVENPLKFIVLRGPLYAIACSPGSWDYTKYWHFLHIFGFTRQCQCDIQTLQVEKLNLKISIKAQVHLKITQIIDSVL